MLRAHRLKLLFIAWVSWPLLCAAQSSTPIPVFATRLGVQTFADNIEAIGTLRANEAVTITAAVTDTIRAIHFDDGDRVSKNDVLVEMTSDEEHALLEEAQSLVNETQRQYSRVKRLIKDNLTTDSIVDERRQSYEAANARLLATQSRLADRLIVAPFDGVLGLRHVSVGTLVRPGDTITTLDDDSVMKLDISLPAVHLRLLEKEMEVQAKSVEIDGRFTGTVTSIDSRIDPVTRSIVVRAQIPNNAHSLRPGMMMTVQLQTPARETLLIPEESIVQEGFHKYIYVVETGAPTKVRRTEIKTGAQRQGMVVVDSGVNQGALVVTHGIMRLKDGAAVTVTAEDNSEQPLKTMLDQNPKRDS